MNHEDFKRARVILHKLTELRKSLAEFEETIQYGVCIKIDPSFFKEGVGSINTPLSLIRNIYLSEIESLEKEFENV